MVFTIYMNPTEELRVGMVSMDRPTLTALLDAGADIDVLGNRDWTLLMCAVLDHSLEWCSELLKRGARVHVRNRTGWTAWDLLYPNDTPLYSLLLQYGADVNHYNPVGLTQLHWACCCNHHDAILFFLTQGADPRLPALSDDEYYKGKTACNLGGGAFWGSPEGRRARLRWDTVSIQEVFIVASELGIVPIPSYLW